MFKGGRVNEEGKCHLKTRASRPRPADRVWGWRHSELRAERKHRGAAVFPLDSGKNVHNFGSVCLCASVEQNLMRSKASTCDQPPAP